MAKGKKGVDGIDKVIDLFPPGSHKMIERLLARAADREAKQAGRNVKAAMRALSGRGGRSGGKVLRGLASNLAKALRQRGDVGGKASIRQRAPDTGGRPFHFAHSVISKEDGAPSASGRAPAGAKGAGPGGVGGTGFGKTGRASAHMRYIEREIAVERTYGQGVDEVGRAADGRVAERDGSRERSVEREGVGAEGQVHATSATAGQGYIENPVKLANGEQVIFSFGTIGDRFEARVRFWEALEEAEAHPQARVQHRLIVELPHEATPQARHEMMRTFAKRFEDDGVPYWAALHAPGKDNDSRNYHAHIVYSERPAKRMVDPERPQDGEKWDFEIVRTYRTSSRNTLTSRPHRQAKARAYTARDFIKKLRGEFSETVNAVLVRDEVKDAKGQRVLYDARSYKSMGVDAVPMRSINRIVADKMKDGQLTVLDGDYTRRMITAELRDAAAKRQKGVMELIALDNALRATAASARPQEQNGKLPRDLRISPWASPGRAALKAASRKILEARHAALQIDVMERATTASLERIIAATTPKAVDAAARNKDPAVKAEAASPDAARLLHAAALDELAETRASTAKARRSMAYRVVNAVNDWRALVQAKPPEIGPAVKAAIQEMDLREERAERSPPRVPEAAVAPTDRSVDRSGKRPEGTGSPVRAESRSARGADEWTRHGTSYGPTRPTVDLREPDSAGRKNASETTRDAVASRGAAGLGGRTDVSGPGQAAPSRGKAPRTQAATERRPTATIVRPKSMEDVLRVRMPPTVPELEEASRAVTSLIKAATQGEDDVDVRTAKVEALVDAMKADVRRRKGLPPLEGDALKPTSMRLDDKSASGERPMAQSQAPAGLGVAALDQEASHGGCATEPPKGLVEASSSESGRLGEAGPPLTTTTAGPTAAQGLKENVTPLRRARDPASEPETVTRPEDPDDARRRKTRREDIEKRKRLRKAVLARNNRGRER